MASNYTKELEHRIEELEKELQVSRDFFEKNYEIIRDALIQSLPEHQTVPTVAILMKVVDDPIVKEAIEEDKKRQVAAKEAYIAAIVKEAIEEDKKRQVAAKEAYIAAMKAMTSAHEGAQKSWNNMLSKEQEKFLQSQMANLYRRSHYGE